jgi:hypothetical protein
MSASTCHSPSATAGCPAGTASCPQDTSTLIHTQLPSSLGPWATLQEEHKGEVDREVGREQKWALMIPMVSRLGPLCVLLVNLTAFKGGYCSQPQLQVRKLGHREMK